MSGVRPARRAHNAAFPAAALALLLSACGRESPAPEAMGTPAQPAPETLSRLPRQPLPLGLGSLGERWEQCVLAEGLILTRILRGEPSREAPALPCAGIDTFRLEGGGSGRITLTQEGGPRPNGPWAVHVLEIDPARFTGRMRSVLGRDAVVGKEAPSAVGIRLGAIASINGGYFVVGEGNDQVNADGIAGDPAGAAVLDGLLLSEAVQNRTVMAWRAGAPGSTVYPALRSRQALRLADGNELALDGLNRIAGRIRMCGGSGDAPTDEPRHDQTCTDADELIAYQPIWGRDTPGEEADLELPVGADGRAQATRAPGGPIPAGGYVLAASGPDSAAALQAVATGSAVQLVLEAEANGQPLALRPGLDVVNGGPLLVQGGALVNREVEEGFVEPLGGDPGENPVDVLVQTVYLLGYRQTGQPRTLSATTADGRLLLVLVDGRRMDWSVGLTFQDASELLLHFGAKAGMNLDGGGSAALWVRSPRAGAPAGAVVNVVSGGGEREVSDAIVLLPE